MGNTRWDIAPRSIHTMAFASLCGFRFGNEPIKLGCSDLWRWLES